MLAEQIEDYPQENELEIYRAISKKWLSSVSNSYFKFILELANKNFFIEFKSLSEEEKIFVYCFTMMYGRTRVDLIPWKRAFGQLEK